MRYDILDAPGELSVTGADWLGALGAALEALGLDRASMGQLHVRLGRGGEVDVQDPTTGRRFRLAPVEDVFGAPAGEPPTPAPTPSPAAERPPDLAARLAAIAARITGAADEGLACVGALDGLRALVPAGSGAVLLARGDQLEFRAAFGPVAAGVRGQRMAADAGVAGFTHQLGLGVVVNRADLDLRHDKTLDQRLGHQTLSLLAAPLRGLDGAARGVLQLVNAPTAFRPWHLEAARGVADDLAAHLARVEASTAVQASGGGQAGASRPGPRSPSW